jgi:hypothetical protein
MKTFKSKISLPLFGFFCVALAGGCTALALLGEWYIFTALFLLSLFALYCFTSIRYQINDNKLSVLIGFFYQKEIEISAITAITTSNNTVSAPAASFNRLEIFYGKHESVLISPQQSEEFIQQLHLINPAIAIKRTPE